MQKLRKTRIYLWFFPITWTVKKMGGRWESRGKLEKSILWKRSGSAFSASLVTLVYEHLPSAPAMVSVALMESPVYKRWNAKSFRRLASLDLQNQKAVLNFYSFKWLKPTRSLEHKTNHRTGPVKSKKSLWKSE